MEKSYRVTPDGLILDEVPKENKPNSKRKIYVYLRPVDPQQILDSQDVPNVSENDHEQGTEQKKIEEPEQSPEVPEPQLDRDGEKEQMLKDITKRGSPKTLNNRMHSILEFSNFN